MGDNTGATVPGHEEQQPTALDKGKGKAPQEDVSMGEEEETSSDEESGPEELGDDDDEEETADDKLEPISTENILQGSRRTRGKTIDYDQAASKGSDEEMDDDEDDDYQAADDDTQMKG